MNDFAAFQALAARGNVIPVVRECIADFETPISLAAKLRERGKFFLLESIEGGEKWGRFSILGCQIQREIEFRGDRAVLVQRGEESVLPGNPVDALQAYLAQFHAEAPAGLPRFFGGAVGYFAFESVRFFERCGTVKPHAGRFPDGYFMIADKLLIFDNLTHNVHLVCCVHPAEHASLEEAWESAEHELDNLEAILTEPAARPGPHGTPRQLEMRSNMPREGYEQIVRRGCEYIGAGDVIQVVLAQHFSTELTAADAFDVYRALRYVNPSPYMFFVDLADGRCIAGSSPEVMVRVTGRTAEIRPIAGTRPRGRTPEEDARLATELLADPKERAEHVMLVDLARNDLGRIAEIGTVEVTDYMTIERYSHVMHIVSHVVGTVREDCDALDVFKASFPAGTLSGAPKVRAMEIINELEPTRRGPYGGALGYIGYGGRVMDLAITIRTVVIDGRTATVTAGAGIVYDSVPAREYEETVHKSQGMRRALQLAENGLRLGGDFR